MIDAKPFNQKYHTVGPVGLSLQKGEGSPSDHQIFFSISRTCTFFHNVVLQRFKAIVMKLDSQSKVGLGFKLTT